MSWSCYITLFSFVFFKPANFFATENFQQIDDFPFRYIYLTWQHEPDTTITINIHNFSEEEEVFIYYDTLSHQGDPRRYRTLISDIGKENPSFLDGRFIHHVELFELIPGKTYYFIVGNPSTGFTQEAKFKTISDQEENLHFVEGGDWEYTQESIEVAKQAAKQNPLAVFLGGDYPSWAYELSDYDKWDAWLDMYCKHMITDDGCLIPMVLAIGNHEVLGGFGQTPDQVPFFLHLFPQNPENRTYFSRCFGKNLILFVLDSGHATSHDGEQLQWLENEFENFKDVPIKFALYHVPIYPCVRFSSKDIIFHTLFQIFFIKGEEEVANRMFAPYSEIGKKFWLPIFDRYRLTAAFEHHDQALKRTHPLRQNIPQAGGTVYFGDGGWGCALQYLPVQSYFRPYFATTMGKVHFFWDIQINESYIKYQAISPKGQVYDSYIQKFTTPSLLPPNKII